MENDVVKKDERRAAWERSGKTRNERHAAYERSAKTQNERHAAWERSAKMQNERPAAWERIFAQLSTVIHPKCDPLKMLKTMFKYCFGRGVALERRGECAKKMFHPKWTPKSSRGNHKKHAFSKYLSY